MTLAFLIFSDSTKLLNETTADYRCCRQIIYYLLYIDDVTIFTKNTTEQRKVLKIVHSFSKEIRMGMGMEKCAKMILRRGKLTNTENTAPDIDKKRKK